MHGLKGLGTFRAARELLGLRKNKRDEPVPSGPRTGGGRGGFYTDFGAGSGKKGAWGDIAKIGVKTSMEKKGFGLMRGVNQFQ